MSTIPSADRIFIASRTDPRLTDSKRVNSVSAGRRSPGRIFPLSSSSLMLLTTKSTDEALGFEVRKAENSRSRSVSVLPTVILHYFGDN